MPAQNHPSPTAYASLYFHNIPFYVIDGVKHATDLVVGTEILLEEAPPGGPRVTVALTAMGQYPLGLSIHLTWNDAVCSAFADGFGVGSARRRLGIDIVDQGRDTATGSTAVKRKQIILEVYASLNRGPIAGKSSFTKDEWFDFMGEVIKARIVPPRAHARLIRYEPVYDDDGNLVSVRMFNQEKRFYWHALEVVVRQALHWGKPTKPQKKPRKARVKSETQSSILANSSAS